MAYDYFGASVFHAVVRMLNDGEQVSHETLFRLVLERMTDRSTWLRDELQRQAARLASVANGTRATVLGTKDLSGIVPPPVETRWLLAPGFTRPP